MRNNQFFWCPILKLLLMCNIFLMFCSEPLRLQKLLVSINSPLIANLHCNKSNQNLPNVFKSYSQVHFYPWSLNELHPCWSTSHWYLHHFRKGWFYWNTTRINSQNIYGPHLWSSILFLLLYCISFL